jgi:sporulation protein YlmC with PRC-barrel domain
MRTLLVVLGATALASTALAQQQPQVTPSVIPQGQAAAKAGIAECDRLVDYLEETPEARKTVPVDQASKWRESLDANSCHSALQRLTGEGSAAQQAEPGINATSQSPATLGAVTPPAQPGGAEPAQTGALPGQRQAVKVNDLEDKAVVNGRGEKIGEVDEVRMGADNKVYLIVEHGGFLGLGEKKAALPADQVVMRGDQLVADTLTDEQIKAFPEFKESANFKELAEDQTAEIRVQR